VDRIKIKDLLLRTIIGVNDWERREKQDVIINVEIFCDLKKPSETDNISDTLDYKELKKRIVSIVENSSFYLVEALAGKIANLCINYPGVKKVCVEVDKPGALRFARSVSVIAEREWSDVFLGIGSNIEPESNIKKALKYISEKEGIKVEKVSRFLITPPIDKFGNKIEEQPHFINGVAKIKTYFTQDEFSEFLRKVEISLGRTEKGGYEPRTIDLDVLLWFDSSGNLRFAHKDVFERNFVSLCIYDIEPNLLVGDYHIFDIIQRAKVKVDFKETNLSFIYKQ
jgi:2-amino-4-hydroxy-6-hydroxymethyldihydropteridine diphosphokinase